MTTLFITTEVPAPRGGGGPIANYYHLRGLVEAGHEIVLVCLVPGESADAPRIPGVARTVLVPGAGPTAAWRYFANLFEKEPVPIRKYMGVKAARALRDLALSHNFDLAHFASLHTAHLLDSLRATSRCPAVLFEHNIQARVHELFYRQQKGAARRGYARLQWRKMLAYEAEACRGFDRVLTFSRVDADTLSRMSPESEISWLPLAVDVRGLSERPASREEIDFLWIGSLRWLPNVDSLEWFVDEILPRILSRRPTATVALAGSSPPEWLRSVTHRGPGVRVLGEVDDAYELMARSRIVLVPLRIGSGVRVKIIEALALGRAVLSTTLGCEGIEAEPGTHLVVADEPDDFAREALALLEDEDRRRSLGARGRELALARHDFRTVGRDMSALYRSLESS